MTEAMSPIPRWRDAPPHDMHPLEWWAGVYDHVFVALHPFQQTSGAEPLNLRWSEAHQRFGKGSYTDFARCVFLLACGGYVREWPSLDASYADELAAWIDQNQLRLPDHDWLSSLLAQSYAECVRRCGVESVVLVERPTEDGRRASVRCVGSGR